MRYKIIPLAAIIVALVFGAATMGYAIGLRTSVQTQVAGAAAIQPDPVSPVTNNSSDSASLRVVQASSSAEIASPVETLTTQFYSWYIDCVKANGTCDYKSAQEVDSKILMQKIKTAQTTGYDPIFCAQNTPNSFRIDHSTQDTPALSSVYVVESFAQEQVQLIVEVESRPEGPKIVNVICPRP